MQIQSKGILTYITPSGQDPYRQWYIRNYIVKPKNM